MFLQLMLPSDDMDIQLLLTKKKFTCGEVVMMTTVMELYIALIQVTLSSHSSFKVALFIAKTVIMVASYNINKLNYSLSSIFSSVENFSEVPLGIYSIWLIINENMD